LLWWSCLSIWISCLLIRDSGISYTGISFSPFRWERKVYEKKMIWAWTYLTECFCFNNSLLIVDVFFDEMMEILLW
jgi:hypothetical protein